MKKADAKKADALKVDGPKADAKKADALKVDGPKADAKKADALKVDGPKGCGSITQIGCCVQNTLYWCDNNTLKVVNCASPPPEKCGWDEDWEEYMCGASDLAAPGNTPPKDCP